MKIAVIGASSFVGRNVFSFLEKKTDYNLIGTYFNHPINDELVYLDATSYPELDRFFKVYSPDFVLLIAGNKDVKACEQDYKLAYYLNVVPLENIVSIIIKNNHATKIIYVSSDYVFDGEKGCYADTDLPKPKTNYGKSKFEAEQVLLRSDTSHKVIRTSALIGRGSIFFEWLLKQLNSGNKVHLFSNIYFTPTPVSFFAEMMSEIVEKFDHIDKKILHVVGNESFNRYEFAKLCQTITKNYDAELISEEVGLDNCLFQKDLSMLQTNFIKQYYVEKLETYIEKELGNDESY